MERTAKALRTARVGKNGLRSRSAFWIAVSGGAGLIPLGPGTAGALVGTAVAFLLSFAPAGLVVILLGGLFALAVWASSVVEGEWGSDDPQFVVIDETVGAAATLCLLPLEPAWWVAGFVAFRLFDIVKPWPIRLVHHEVRGGLGIVLDDAIAAAMAAGLLLAANLLYFVR